MDETKLRQAAEIPVIAVGGLPSLELCLRAPEGVRALITEALSRRSHPLLPLATGLIDRLSHSWLVRQANPYLDEIRQVAAAVGRPGTFFLNTIYEWACSTSVAADPAGGARMIRVLDWGLSGIGRHVVVARHETAHGPFYSATWPGYAGVLTGMAPGRFSAAINQAPQVPALGWRVLDEIVTRWRVLRSRGTLPATHLLRRAFEKARDFAAALEVLADERVDLAMPAIFALAGTEPDQCCVVEALGRLRRVHRAAGGACGVANQWLSPDLEGRPRNRSIATGAPITPEANNAARALMIRALQRGAFAGAADLPEPVLNSHTVMVVVANAGRGEMTVEALDPPAGAILPRVVARGAVRHGGPSSRAVSAEGG
ncbi:MAG TPA: hypothetical protein VEI03_11990 [Stellaceae bacterium]|nr:hypothetical protein [Stellaceae bacterium]